MQFLGPLGSERCAVVAGSSQADSALVDSLLLSRHGTAMPTVIVEPEPVSASDQPVFEISEHMLEELDFIDDDDVRKLARQAMERGAPDFTAGIEDENGAPIQVVWESPGVGIASAGADHQTKLNVRSVADWTLEELLAALEGTT